ncbi:MAG: hypothetical protein RL637_1626 [Pseudomonadota bacterium]|jgi:outer membrane receptor for ferrienterochelin and colicin
MNKLLFYFVIFILVIRIVYASDIQLERELDYLRAEREASMIEVVSKKSETVNNAAAIINVITHEEIERYGGNSLIDILNRVTSIYMLGDRITNQGILSMRGDLSDVSSLHTLVLINGRPFRDNGLGGYYESIFRDFPIHQIERLEIIRGPGSALYGSNAFSVVVNIVTRQKEPTGLTLRGRYGSFQSWGGEAEFSWQNAQAFTTGAIRYRGSKGWKSNLKSSVDFENHLRMDDNDFSANLTAQWDDLTLNSYVAKFHHNTLGASGFLKADGNMMNNERFFLDLGYKQEINSHWLVQSNFTYNQFIDEEQIPAWTGQALEPTLIRLSENNLLFEQTHFLNYFHNDLNITFGGLVEWQTGRINQVSAPPPLSPYSHIRSSLYGEINYQLLKDLKLVVGGQWHHFEHLEKDNDYNDKPIQGLVGKFGLVYQFNQNWGMKLLYNQAFRSAASFELEANAIPIQGTRNLQPEKVNTIDAQLFYQDKKYQLAITAFRSHQKDFISTKDCDPGPCVYTNQGSLIYQGLEIETQADLLDNLQWQGAYTFQTNWNHQGQYHISIIPTHIAKIGLNYEITPQWQISIFDSFFSKSYLDRRYELLNHIPSSYHYMTLNSRYQLNRLWDHYLQKPITLTLFVDNLLNEKIDYPNFEFNSLPGRPGRSIYGEIAITF